MWLGADKSCPLSGLIESLAGVDEQGQTIQLAGKLTPTRKLMDDVDSLNKQGVDLARLDFIE